MKMVVVKKEQEEMAESQEEDGAEKVGRRERVFGARNAKKKKKKKKTVVHEPTKIMKRACADCTKRCARVHGGASSSETDKSRSVAATLPSFFKVMMGCFSENMDIPPSFAKTISDLADSNIYLEDAFGFRWRVFLLTHGDFISFGHGWKNFVLDHAIGVGEFLVFRRISRSVFTVQIFAPSACERLYLCESNQRQCRKRRHQEKASSPYNQTLKSIKNNLDIKRVKKKQRTHSLQNDPSMRNYDVSIVVRVDSDIPGAALELKCCGTSEKTPCIDAAKSDEVDEDVFARDQDCGTSEKTPAIEAAKSDEVDEDVTAKDQDKAQYVSAFKQKCRETSEKTPCIHASKSDEVDEEVIARDQDKAQYVLALEQKCCGTSEKTPAISAAESHEVHEEVSARDQDKVQRASDGETQTADECTIRKQKEDECSADVGEQHAKAHIVESMAVTETENCRGSGFPINTEVGTYLEMMDLTREISDDIFLSADAYEFESDFCNPEAAFSVELDMEMPTIHGQISFLGCVKNEDDILCHSTVELKEGVIPKDYSAKQDHLQLQGGSETGRIAAENMPGSPMPSEIPELRPDPMEPGNMYAGDNSESLKEAKQDHLQLKDGSETGHIAAENMPGSPMPGETRELRRQNPIEPGNNSESMKEEANNRKFCVAVPSPDQTWLELPRRLPVIPWRRKHGRKVVVVSDPGGRRWPVLYHCTSSFNGFIAGWVEIRGENGLQEGDACEFQLGAAGSSELSFRVRQ